VTKLRAPRPSPAPRSSSRTALVFAAIALLTLVAYLPSFSAPFQFDDYSAIIDNAKEREEAGMSGLNWMGARILPAASFMLNYRIGGDQPFGYHVVNFAVHLLAGLAVFQLALALARTPRLRDTAPAREALVWAAVAALVFACHPIQTQAVTYIVQRMASMAAMFYLWGVVFYLWARLAVDERSATFCFAAAALSGLCAVLSKENAVSLPLALLLVEATFFGGIRGVWIVRLIPLAILAGSVPILWHLWFSWDLMPGASLAERILRITRQTFSPARLGTSVSPLDYFLTQGLVVPRYLGLTLAPLGLNVDHDIAVLHRLDLAAVAGLASLAALAVASLSLLRRLPIVSFALLWTLIALSVESSLLPLNDAMMEHRMYLALPGIALAAGAGIVWLRGRIRSVGTVAALVLVLVLPTLTYARNLVWGSTVSLWSDAARKSPRKARTQLNAGVAHHGERRLDEAVRYYCRALALHPSQGIAELANDNLEIALEDQGKLDGILRELVAKSPHRVGEDGTVKVEYDLAKAVCPTATEAPLRE
jgi:hypothetical protein